MYTIEILSHTHRQYGKQIELPSALYLWLSVD